MKPRGTIPDDPSELWYYSVPIGQNMLANGNGCKLAFLDVLVTRKDERLLTSVYRKPTHTERYICFNSHHHRKTITGVLRSMRDQAHRICDPSTKPQELHHLKNVFEANGFPPNLVKKTLQVPPKSAPPPPTEDPQTEEPQKTLANPLCLWSE